MLGIRALSHSPKPALDQRRNWARTAAILGAAHIVLVVTVILMNLDRLSKVIDAFRALSDLQ